MVFYMDVFSASSLKIPHLRFHVSSREDPAGWSPASAGRRRFGGQSAALLIRTNSTPSSSYSLDATPFRHPGRNAPCREAGRGSPPRSSRLLQSPLQMIPAGVHGKRAATLGCISVVDNSHPGASVRWNTLTPVSRWRDRPGEDAPDVRMVASGGGRLPSRVFVL